MTEHPVKSEEALLSVILSEAKDPCKCQSLEAPKEFLALLHSSQQTSD
jgi:hypothetical protein